MNLNETGELLARIQVHDNRQVGAVTIEEWQHDLDGVSYADALEAVRAHRKASTEYLTANHVLQGVKRIRSRRLEGVDDIDPPPAVAEGTVQDYLDWKRRLIREVADGTYVAPEAPAVTGKPMPKELGRNLRRPDDLPPVPGERD